MVNIAHAALTGAEVHEPKGIVTAAGGTVYVANGSGSGSWANVGTSSFTGMIADFVWPVVQSGWLELDGSDISTSTYSGLYGVMTMQITGTRTNASPVITSIASTTGFQVGYYVFGTGFAAGTTIISIDSATQITVSNNAASSGTAALAVSPWYLNTGTIRLPDTITAGRFRRSRTSSTAVGQTQAGQNLAHTHTGSATTGNNNLDHTHSFSGTSGVENQTITHNVGGIPVISGTFNNNGGGGGSFAAMGNSLTTVTSSGQLANHTHSFSGVTSGASTAHTHSVSFTTDSSGATETRPVSLVVMTCVKT